MKGSVGKCSPDTTEYPSYDVSELHKIRPSPDHEALKL